jgi:hypothetical protein
MCCTAPRNGECILSHLLRRSAVWGASILPDAFPFARQILGKGSLARPLDNGGQSMVAAVPTNPTPHHHRPP